MKTEIRMRADQFVAGDLVDLEGDRFGDPVDGDFREAHKFELSEVHDSELETPTCLRLGFENEGSYGMPPEHELKAWQLHGIDNGLEHQAYPHEAGRLHNCPLCEARCWCDSDPGHTECVFEGVHRWAERRKLAYWLPEHAGCYVDGAAGFGNATRKAIDLAVGKGLLWGDDLDEARLVLDAHDRGDTVIDLPVHGGDTRTDADVLDCMVDLSDRAIEYLDKITDSNLHWEWEGGELFLQVVETEGAEV